VKGGWGGANDLGDPTMREMGGVGRGGGEGGTGGEGGRHT